MALYAAYRKEFLADRPLDEAWLILAGKDKVAADACQALYKLNGTLPRSDNPPHGLPKQCPLSCDVHHVRRRGRYYLDRSTWLAVSRQLHQKIHDESLWARMNGLLA